MSDPYRAPASGTDPGAGTRPVTGTSPRAAAPDRRRTRSARLITLTGALVLVLAGVVAVLTAGLFVRTLPVDVLTLGGDDGAGVLGSVAVPGTGEVELAEGAYTLYVAHPSTADDGAVPDRDAVTVTAPDGATVPLGPPSVTGNVAMGTTAATTLAGLDAPEAGAYTLTAHEGSWPAEARLLVVADAGFGAFFGGLMGTVVGVFVVLGIGAVGLGLTVAGAILWYRRSRPDQVPA